MNPKELFEQAKRQLWHPNSQLENWSARLRFMLQLFYCTSREVLRGELTLRAMSLVYTTLLSLVPLLALAFSVLKGLGIHNRIEPMLLGVLEPLGPSAPRITETLIGFVDNVKIGVLGSVGIAMLFYTVLSMIQKIEVSFNHIWKIPRQRPLGQRVSEYLVVLLIGPLAMTLILGMTASLSSHQAVAGLLNYSALNEIYLLFAKAFPYVLIIGVFSFVFWFIPNTNVAFKAALTGGVVSGLLWQSAAWTFANFVAGSGDYNAVYSGFAILILLLIWLYLAWLILLIGCQISFFMQNQVYLRQLRDPGPMSCGLQEQLSLYICALVAQRFRQGDEPIHSEKLSSISGFAPDLVNPVLAELIENGILIEGQAGELLLKQDPSTLTLKNLLAHIDRPQIPGGPQTINQELAQLQKDLTAAREKVLSERTLAQLHQNKEEN